MKPIDADTPNVAAEPRLVPRKLGLRVSGARAGSTTRPGALEAARPALPTRQVGLRIHGRGLGADPVDADVADGGDARDAARVKPVRPVAPAPADDGDYDWAGKP